MKRFTCYTIGKESMGAWHKRRAFSRGLVLSYILNGDLYQYDISLGDNDERAVFIEGDVIYLVGRNVNLGYISLQTFTDWGHSDTAFIQEDIEGFGLKINFTMLTLAKRMAKIFYY